MRKARLRTFIASLAIAFVVASQDQAFADPVRISDRIFDRDVEIWFGTLSVTGVPASSHDAVELSDTLSSGLLFIIDTDPTTDPRVAQALSLGGPWDSGQSNLDWVLGTPANLPAQQNLLDAYTAFALSTFGPGFLTVSSPIGSTASYVLESVDTIETAPVFVGDTDNPFLEGGDGQEVLITNKVVGNVNYFQQNATWTVIAAAVPEPPLIALLLIGLAGLRIARKR